ncbi:MAG: thioredoxin [Paludibacteraceae bacterium]|nr:thioredoxin [Paludibacteraceae bacterium]
MKKILLSLVVITSFLYSCAQEQKVEIRHITKAEFLENVWNYEANPNEWKYEGKLPCIVDFYASWCGPCRRLAPILEELQQEYQGKIIIYKVNTETERELAAAFGIQSIPTLLFCPMDRQPSISKGLVPKEALEKAIEQNLLGK